jgi:Rrf2 family protein
MIDLTLQPNHGPASVRAIAERQDLPHPYLEKLLIDLRRAGLLRSLRGAQGGYQLAYPPERILVGDILAAVGEGVDPQPLAATHPEDWVMQSLWRRLEVKLEEALFTISLADLYYDARSWQASQGEETNFVV